MNASKSSTQSISTAAQTNVDDEAYPLAPVKSLHQLFSLQGQVALVTGASSGFGRRFAHVLAAAGAKVACAARRKDKLDSVVAAISAMGGEAVAIEMDMSDNDSIRCGFTNAEAMIGPITILINNAGIFDPAHMTEMTDQQWDRVMRVNVTGPFVAAQEFAKRLIPHQLPGVIVNISSIFRQLAKPGRVNYCVSKAALAQMTRSMALDLAEYSIRVNTIAPGYFATPISAPFDQTEQGRKEVANLPSGRRGRVEELDGALLLLASTASSYISGATIEIDYAHSCRISS